MSKDEMNYKEFTAEVEQRIKENLSLKEQCFFAWLCAVRSLPFLNNEREFGCWEKNEIVVHLQSIFYALDIIIFVHTDAVTATIDAATAVTDAVTAVTAAVTVAKATTDTHVNDVVYATAYATFASYFYYAANASKAANAAAKAAANAADAATKATAFTNNVKIKNISSIYRRRILNDIEVIKAGQYSTIQNDTDIYGELWKNFQNDLNEIGCGYWAKLYADMFANRFQFDAKAMEDLYRRINVPTEIRELGAKAVADYLVNIEKQGMIYIQRETRLVVLGSAGAGKTTLVRRLNGDPSNPAPKDSTHGVDTSIMLDFNGIKTHVWDFGGQVIYHASHRCFISENCVYILVVNARTEDHHDINRIKYWLDTIRIYSNNKAKVFIVINESDNRKQKPEDYGLFKQGEYASLVQGIHGFNISDDVDQVNKFKETLSNYIDTIGHQVLGQNDFKVINEINALFDKKTQILESAKIDTILRDNGIINQKDQKRAKELFNTLGVALSYDFIKSFVIDPYWISHGVYMVIDYLQKNNIQFLNYNELDFIFADDRESYADGKKEYILELMEYYEIGFRNEGGVRGMIVPCAAVRFRPTDITVNEGQNDFVTYVERDNLQEFPADFFYRYICANQNDIKKDGEKWAMWQEGMVLAGENASAVVQLIENRRIEIVVWGNDKKNYIKKLEALINDLLQEYNFKSYEEKRKKGDKVVKTITLVFEAITKGAVDAVLERFAGGFVKSKL